MSVKIEGDVTIIVDGVNPFTKNGKITIWAINGNTIKSRHIDDALERAFGKKYIEKEVHIMERDRFDKQGQARSEAGSDLNPDDHHTHMQVDAMIAEGGPPPVPDRLQDTRPERRLSGKIDLDELARERMVGESGIE